MKKKLFLLLGLIAIAVGLFGYWLSVYRSLENPFDEMYYSETENINILGLRPLSEVIGSKNHYNPVEQDVSILDYQTDYLGDNESMEIYLTENKSYFQFLYHLQLEEEIYLNIYYSYEFKSQSIVQKISISDKTGTKNIMKEPQILLSQLSSYNKTLTWLESLSRKVLEEDILGLWFEKGSNRYSLDNLGNLTIEYDEVLEDTSDE